MSILKSIIKKEVLHLIRDARTVMIVLVMPVVLLVLFGFAISTEVNNVRVVAVTDRHTDATRLAIERMQANPYFTFEGVVSYAEIEDMLRKGKTDAAIIFRHDGGKPDHRVVVDASNTNMAQASAAYIESVVGAAEGLPAVTTTLYNPQHKSAYNFVPGIMGMIFMLICAMMTSVSIVSEKESGTMNLLLVSPVRPSTIIIGKLVPYFLLSFVMLTLMLVLSYTVLGIPFSASVVSVVWLTLLYIILALALGLLVSTVVSSQVSALLVSGVMFIIPVVMLSGMIFPVENMPPVLQGISCLIPARWYISAMRVLMIQQLPAGEVLTETAVLAAMTVAVIAMAVRKFNSKK